MKRLVAGLILGGAIASGCSGSVEVMDGTIPGAEPGSSGEAAGSGGRGPGAGGTTGAGAAGGGAASPGGAGGGGAGPVAACTGKLAIGATLMRRMTVTEYGRTARALVGLPATAPLTLNLPEESRVGAFENNATVQTLSSQHLLAFLGAAEELAAGLVADTRRRDAVVGCAPTAANRAACTRSFVEKFGRLAFRRPLASAEVDAYTTLAATADGDANVYAGIERVIAAMLTAPSFLFLAETGTPDPQRPGLVRLSGYELASRLSYFLWGAGPDGALLDAARDGKLDTPEGLLAQARAMAKDPRAAQGQRDFFARWLGLVHLSHVERDTKKYAAWSPALRTAMEQETLRFIDDLVARDGSSLLDLVSSDRSFVNDALARLYGVQAPAAGAWAQVSNPQRAAGILTQASFLTMTASSELAAPIKRGQFVRETLLCEPLPSPPADIPSIEELKLPATASDRERLGAHVEKKECAGCHQMMDPIGFGLGNFDAIGAYRTVDSHMRPVDARGQIAGMERGEFNGAKELGALLRSSPKVGRCVTSQLFRYASARAESPEDACTVNALAATFEKSGYRFPALVEAMVQHEAFRYRRPVQGGSP